MSDFWKKLKKVDPLIGRYVKISKKHFLELSYNLVFKYMHETSELFFCKPVYTVYRDTVYYFNNG